MIESSHDGGEKQVPRWARNGKTFLGACFLVARAESHEPRAKSES